ncbi:MAG: phosphotransferase [Proteobacteria bacterium]|nr:phosphotransferase [Pseudomonadota bacterium]
MDRFDKIKIWVKGCLGEEFTFESASSDASFRHYFRIFKENQSYILMDAPPQKESIQPFLEVANLMLEAKANAPKIHSSNIKLGTILMEDFGLSTYLDVITADNAGKLYRDATQALVHLQKKININNIRPYDQIKLSEEMMLFCDWYLVKYKKITLSEKDNIFIRNFFKFIAEKVYSQPQVFVHRDFHSRNLMFLSDSDRSPGILDFQDALIGPITYDLVSLLKDAYVEWDEELIIDQSVRYWQNAKKEDLPIQEDFSQFYEDFEWMGVQRHLKILGIFSRLSIRDNKDQYLKNIPLVEKYLWNVIVRYKELFPLRNFLEKVIAH